MLSLKKFLLIEEKEKSDDPLLTPVAKVTNSFSPSKDEVIMQYLDSTYKNPENNKGYSIKYTFNGRELTLRYSTIVHMASEVDLRPQVSRFKEESNQILNNVMNSLKSHYKKVSKETLKEKLSNENDSVELIQSTANSLRKVAYYRVNRTYSIDG